MKKYREDLEKLGGEDRYIFRGTFVRTGCRGGHTRFTVLIQNVRKKGSSKIITDHIWFNYTDGFKKLNLESGDEIEFTARVKEYKKGYWGDNERKAKKRPPASISYKLSYPTKIKKTGKKNTVKLIESNWTKKKSRK